MAYPTVSGAYGALPINLIGGRVYSGATRQIPIASGYAKNIGFGDWVSIVAAGTITRVDAGVNGKVTFAISPCGIFLGCSYTDPSLKYKIFKQYWPSGTVASDAVAIVADDPDIMFKMAIGSGATQVVTASGATQASVGANFGYYIKADVTGWADGVNTNTGDSTVWADLATINTTVGLPLRLVDVVKETQLSDGTYCEGIFTYNLPYTTATYGTSPTVTVVSVGGHQYRNPLGI